MMVKLTLQSGARLILGALAFLLLTAAGYEYEDPFVPMLPKAVVKPPPQQAMTVAMPVIVTAPDLTIQGVLWGTDKPMAIINGQVYAVGAQLKGLDGKVYKIENNTVTVMYKTKLFPYRPKSALNKEEPR